MKSGKAVVGVFGLVSISVFGFACSPAADPIGKGQVHFQIAYPTDPQVTQTCSLPGVGGIGDPPPSLPVGTDVSSYGEPVTDGQTIEGSNGNYIVDCTITGGDTHKIDLIIEGPNTSPLAKATDAGVAAKVEIHGSIGADGTGEGTVSAGIPSTGPNTSVGGYPCTLTALLDENGDPDVKGGAASFIFLCPRAQTPLSDFGICETRGTVIVRSCLDE
jgi:hypothetical protein